MTPRWQARSRPAGGALCWGQLRNAEKGDTSWEREWPSQPSAETGARPLHPSAIHADTDTSVGYRGAGLESPPVLPFLSLTPTLSSPLARVGGNKTPILFMSVEKPANKEPEAPRGAWVWTLGAGTAQVPDSPSRAQ